MYVYILKYSLLLFTFAHLDGEASQLQCKLLWTTKCTTFIVPSDIAPLFMKWVRVHIVRIVESETDFKMTVDCIAM
jgi:hypothetical protein